MDENNSHRVTQNADRRGSSNGRRQARVARILREQRNRQFSSRPASRLLPLAKEYVLIFAGCMLLFQAVVCSYNYLGVIDADLRINRVLMRKFDAFLTLHWGSEFGEESCTNHGY